MAKKPRENRVPIMMSDEELTAIDDWRFAQRVATRSDAVRRLCQIGLALSERESRLKQIKDKGMDAAKGVGAAMKAFSESDEDISLQDTDYFDRLDELLSVVFDFSREMVFLSKNVEVAQREAETNEIVERSARLRAQIAEYAKAKWGGGE